MASEFKINFQKNFNYTEVKYKPKDANKAKAHGKIVVFEFRLKLFFIVS